MRSFLERRGAKKQGTGTLNLLFSFETYHNNSKRAYINVLGLGKHARCSLVPDKTSDKVIVIKKMFKNCLRWQECDSTIDYKVYWHAKDLDHVLQRPFQVSSLWNMVSVSLGFLRIRSNRKQLHCTNPVDWETEVNSPISVEIDAIKVD